MSGGETVRAEGLTKRFGARVVLEGIDFRLRAGESVSLFGPNGAGKTTLLRILATLLRPTSGSLRLFGRDPRREEWPRARLGYLSHRSFLYPHLTGRENLAFYGRLYRLSDLDARICRRAEEVGLGDRIGEPVRDFSRGMEQRLSLARALLHDPELLLLDEPFAGVDPVGADRLAGLIAGLRASGCALLIATHNLEEGFALADRLLVLVSGRVVYAADKGRTDAGEFRTRYRELLGAPLPPGAAA
ncbi:MAG: heme ABC exporter ATP-binding protein CcmA [Acidobacteria bacterium]|nr:heme ABC exporter ATP-binding protein CcmA [Acidobacteriota bacterium]